MRVGRLLLVTALAVAASFGGASPARAATGTLVIGAARGGLPWLAEKPVGGLRQWLRPGQWPSFSPDGRRIAFIDESAGIQVAVLDRASGSVRVATTLNPHCSPVQTDAGRPSWNPAGTQVVLVECNTITVVDLATGVHRVVYAATGAGTAFSPDWSPDGAVIAFSLSEPAAGGQAVFVATIRPDGTGLRKVRGGAGTAGAMGPVWSPDGTHLAFVSFAFPGPNPGENLNLAVMNADGSAVVPLTTVDTVHDRRTCLLPSAITWSPDSGRVAVLIASALAQPTASCTPPDRVRAYRRDGSASSWLTGILGSPGTGGSGLDWV